MSQNITDVDAFTEPVTAPATGEAADQATFLAGLQHLANRTRYLYNRLGQIPTLAANKILARASTGATEGKDSTDFTLTMLARATAVAWLDALNTKGADIAAAASTNIAGATGGLVHVTGDASITALGTAAAGVRRVVVFDGAATLTHNGTSLILPNGDDVTATAGDVAEFVSEGSGNWRLVGYQSGTLALYQDVVFPADALSPEVYQAGNDGNDLTIRAQDDTAKIGGDLHLLGGLGDTEDGGTFVGRSAGKLGFFEGAGNVKYAVSGSTIDGTALQSLLDALTAYGLIINETNDS